MNKWKSKRIIKCLLFYITGFIIGVLITRFVLNMMQI